MPLTSGERAALRWLLAIAGVGAGVQLTRHWRDSADASPLAAEALTRQLVSVDSAQRAGRTSRTSSKSSRGRGARRSRASTSPDSATSSVVARSSRRQVQAKDAAGERPTLSAVPVDVDRADSAMLEGLPRIGPALAARIIADRVSRGAFGSIEGLLRVRGIGPKLGQSLRAHVTFSGTPRPSSVHR